MDELLGFDLFTIGYEAASIDDFLGTLLSAGIGTVLDVRELAGSRRRGFAKTALRANLQDHGIAYRHERQLGSPREIRHRLRETGDYAQFFLAFERHLDTQTTLVASLATELTGRVALLCYERNPMECHRCSVAARFARILGGKAEHLVVP